jgi:hypothetical protein
MSAPSIAAIKNCARAFARPFVSPDAANTSAIVSIHESSTAAPVLVIVGDCGTVSSKVVVAVAGHEGFPVTRMLLGELAKHLTDEAAGQGHGCFPESLLAAREVVVERALGRAAFGQDLLQPGRCESLLAEQPHGRSHQVFLVFLHVCHREPSALCGHPCN